MTQVAGHWQEIALIVACPRCGADVGQACSIAPVIHVERSNRIGLDGKPVASLVTHDPMAAAIEDQRAEREQLRAENDRLSRALIAAYTDVEVLSAERDRLCAEVHWLSKIGDQMFAKGYDQALADEKAKLS